MPEIIFKGKTYTSVNQMPPDIRQMYEQVMEFFVDKDQNGVPDILEGTRGAGNVNGQTTPMTFSSTQFVVDGKVYSSADELPPDARQKYEQAMAKVDQVMADTVLADTNQNGLPDILEGGSMARSATSAPSAEPTSALVSSTLMGSSSPVISEDSPNPNWTLLAVGILIGILMVGFVLLGIFVVLPLIK